MASLSKSDVIAALTRLGELALARGEPVELVLVGGSLMVLEFGTRQSTRDVDVVILSPSDAQPVRAMAKLIAAERGWPDDWLNDAANDGPQPRSDNPVGAWRQRAPSRDRATAGHEALRVARRCRQGA